MVFTLALAHKQYYFLVFYVKLMVWRGYEIYNKKKYTKDIPLNYFYKELAFLPMHENTKALMEELLIYYRDHTDKEAFKYFKNIRKKKLYCC